MKIAQVEGNTLVAGVSLGQSRAGQRVDRFRHRRGETGAQGRKEFGHSDGSRRGRSREEVGGAVKQSTCTQNTDRLLCRFTASQSTSCFARQVDCQAGGNRRRKREMAVTSEARARDGEGEIKE